MLFIKFSLSNCQYFVICIVIYKYYYICKIGIFEYFFEYKSILINVIFFNITLFLYQVILFIVHFQRFSKIIGKRSNF